MRTDGWGLLLLWTLGTETGTSPGVASTFVPSPDAFWSFFCLLVLWAYKYYSRRISERASLGDAGAARSTTLPVYRTLLLDVSIGFAAVCVSSSAVMLVVNVPFVGAVYALGILNFLRWFAYELLVEGIGLFFVQRTIGRRALMLALAPAASWACAYAGTSLAVFVIFYGTDSEAPIYAAAALNFVIAVAYGVGPLGFNVGRPALRPYAWFSVIQRVLITGGLVLTALHPSAFPFLLFDLILMAVQVGRNILKV